MLDKVLIVVVVYNKVASDIQLLESINLSPELPDILIYDNSPKNQEETFIQYTSIYHHDPQNPGVGAAYNFGFKYAMNTNKSLVLILDQDTYFDIRFLELYLDEYEKYGDDYIYTPLVRNGDKTKIYSPATLHRFVGKAIPYESFRADTIFDLTGKSVINSGLMIPLSIFKKINGFNEKIKLDFSDVYFIEKYKEINPSVILVPIEMEHSLSGDEQPDINKELHRFKYYCNGAKELARSLDVSTSYTCLRRMLILMAKYYTIQPFITFIKYYLGEVKV